MTDSQLKLILDSVPQMLLAMGVLVTTLVGLYLQVRNKADIKEIKDQGKEIIHQTNSANTLLQDAKKDLQAKLDVSIEKSIGLERLLVVQTHPVNAPTLPSSLIATPTPVVVSDIETEAASKLSDLAKPDKPRGHVVL